MRLRRVSPESRGWTRRRAGRGWTYLDADGRRVAAADAERIKALVIPPAWQNVWISPVANGHIQAVGTDDAGRRQYLYHEEWRLQRDKAKFDRILAVSRGLPRAREQVANDLALEGMPRERALAASKWCVFQPLKEPVTPELVFNAVQERVRRVKGRIDLLQVSHELKGGE